MRFLIFLFLTTFISLESFSQQYWTTERSFPQELDGMRELSYLPTHFGKYSLDLEGMIADCSTAPMESFEGRSQHILYLPMPKGEMRKFEIVESPCMEPEISARYPIIKSYKAVSTDRKSIARFDFGTFGFHAVVNSPEGEIYIDPYVAGELKYYISYFTRDHNEPKEVLPPCGTEDKRFDGDFSKESYTLNRGTNIDLHKFRLALACTGEWGSVRGTKEAALSDMNTSVNRINQIYENEFATRLVLINQNDALIQLNPATDPYPVATLGGSLLGINTNVINSILGSSSGYDLGHVYTNNCTDVGGVAFLSSLCNPGNKGGGVSCYYRELLYISVQVTSHEIGHQLGASHTFNNCSNDGNESFPTGVEPGGGNTIMSYGGLCGGNNYVNNNNDYYNNRSLMDIYGVSRFTDGGAYGCSEKIAINNSPPDVRMVTPDNLTIPISNFFVIEGDATDMEGDNMTYNIEGRDVAFSACPLGEPAGSCPLFRSYPPGPDKFRVFPARNAIMSNTFSKSEVLPTYTREMKFVFTARDNNPAGGVAAWTSTKTVKVDGTSGPLRIIYPNIGESIRQGERVKVLWDVANTNNSIVNCQKVDIYLSQNNALVPGEAGLTLLVPNSDNDGSEEVIIPGVETGNARILIRAVDNIFFDISNYNFNLLPATKPTAYFQLGKFSEDLCLPSQSVVPLNTSGIGGFDGNITFSVDGLPAGVEGTFSNTTVKAGASTDLTLQVANSVPTGSYKIVINGIGDNGDTIVRNYYINVISTDFSDLVSILPLDGEKNSEGPTFTWSKTVNGTAYTIEIATDASFTESSMVYNHTGVDTFYKAPATFPKKMVFFWRVKTLNQCGESVYTPTKVFGTAALSCNTFEATGLPINISSSGAPSIESNINVPFNGSISDINIKTLTINHDNFSDLTASLISPSGTAIKMFNNKCPKKWNVTFALDDQAPIPFACTTVNGAQFRPVEPLSTVNGQEINGVWKLKIDDNTPGNGGKLDKFVLELCGSIALSEPSLLRNQPLQIQPGNKPYITNEYLAVEDAENTPAELVFTITQNVQSGRLLLNGSDIGVGSKFSQADINANALRYIQEGLATNDGFYFIVEDGTGSWIGTYKFNIEIDENFPNAVLETTLDSEVEVFPNPAQEAINVRLSNAALKLNKIIITDVLGRTVLMQDITQSLQRISTSDLSDGIYIVLITNGKEQVSKKLVLSRS